MQQAQEYSIGTFWQSISAIGLDINVKSDMRKKIILSNRFAVYGFVFNFISSFIYISIPTVFVICMVAVSIYSCALLANYFHLYNISRLIIIITAPLLCLIVPGLISQGINFNNKFILLATILAPILLYQLTEWYKMLTGAIWIALCFISYDFITLQIPRLPGIKFDSDYDSPFLVIFSGIAAMVFFFMAFVYVMNLNNANEKSLAESLESSKEKNKIIEQKNAELLAQYKAIANQQEKIKAMNQALKAQALKAQMDPHFMFNVLNSIQHFILENNAEAALGYMSKFSRLTRQVLENSVNETVLITDELKALTYYIELEKLRFDNHFNFTIETDEQIDIQNTEIPSMLLQPYVENAILHGLRHKASGGLLQIILLYQYGFILCIVQDNGIGRLAAAALKDKQSKAHISRATDTNISRIALLQSGAHIVTIDLSNEDGSPKGTRVEIKIPIND